MKKKYYAEQTQWKQILAKRFLALKKQGARLWKNTKPFLVLKYWPIYLLFFGVGVYLWGPAHGYQKIQTWSIFRTVKTTKPDSVETLRLELDKLKRELQIVRSEKSNPAFTPEAFSRPALGKVGRGFEWYSSLNTWRLHNGTDIMLAPGSSVMAAAEGIVSVVNTNATNIYSITLEHGDGWESVYSNLVSITVKKGQRIIKGMILGVSGNSGIGPEEDPSFHFSIYHNHKPVDPAQIITGLAN